MTNRIMDTKTMSIIRVNPNMFGASEGEIIYSGFSFSFGNLLYLLFSNEFLSIPLNIFSLFILVNKFLLFSLWINNRFTTPDDLNEALKEISLNIFL